MIFPKSAAPLPTFTKFSQKMIKKYALFLNILLFAAACGGDKPAEQNTQLSPVVEQPAESPEEVLEKAEDTKPLPAPADEILESAKSQPRAAAGEPVGSAAPLPAPTKTPAPIDAASTAKSGFSDIATLDPSIILDIRYATADNFTKSKIYDCPRCLLRPEAAKALVKAHKNLQKKGLGLKMFDCYRPRPYQQRLWDKVPNPDYVTPPAKGSMHSRGAAVDLTIVDKAGKELDMGTPYDFFGKEAHTDNLNLPAQVLTNRRLLRETLETVGFRGIRTEWWHFSFQGKRYPLSSYVWPCED